MQLNSLGLQNTALDGVVLLQGERRPDLRGMVQTGFNAPQHAAFGLATRYVADIYTSAHKGSLYGLYHAAEAAPDLAQLFTVVRGTAFVVAVDLRPRRKTFGKAISFTLDEHLPQAYLPPGVAWGFAVVSDTADIHQKFTALPVPEQMGGIVWNDPELNIQWPFQRPVTGIEEARFPSLAAAMARLSANVPVREVVIR